MKREPFNTSVAILLFVHHLIKTIGQMKECVFNKQMFLGLRILAQMKMIKSSQFHLHIYWKATMWYVLELCVERNFWHHFCKGPQCGRLGLWHRQGGRRGAPEAAWCTCPSSHPEIRRLRSCICKENRMCAIFGLIIWQEDECLGYL